MKVLVTGGLGYLGSVLVPLLQSKGHEVVVLDQGIFGTHIPVTFPLISQDICVTSIADLLPCSSLDAVIHLAGLSNDPMADFAPAENWRVNAVGTYSISQACAALGIPRFIYASTCSVYGYRAPDSPPAQEWEVMSGYSNYASSKFFGELAVMKHYPEQFPPYHKPASHCIFRMGTLIGPSPRMRWDLAFHPMIKSGIQEGTVRVFDPSSYRPLLDVRDAARAYLYALEHPALTGTFNLSSGNYAIQSVGLMVQDALLQRGHIAEYRSGGRPDVRSYTVSTSALRAQAPSLFRRSIPLYTSTQDAISLATPESLSDPRTVNIEVYKQWLSGNPVVEQLEGAER